MKIYDTKSRKKIEFKPIEEGKVSMYVCGPTVYNKIHIGNARTFISFDTIRRYLEYKGLTVTFVQNLTDVDDKIINRANEERKSPEEVATYYSEKFISDMHDANVIDPTIRPRATQEIDVMIEMIEALIEKNHAYEVEGDVYFDVESDPSYGCLSGRDTQDAESGHRQLIADGVEGLEDRKHNEADFALWKAAKPGEPSWDSPWGKGRPGWHTECVCMSKKYLGLPFDIHGGGSDLIFPHHENEIAQAVCAWDRGFANLWMHGGMLKVDNEKMSKSLGNFLMLDDVLKHTEAKYLRMLCLQSHYRSPLNYSEDRLLEAKKALQNIERSLENLQWQTENATADTSQVDTDKVHGAIDECKDSFVESMDDDFNAPSAIGHISKFINTLNSEFNGVELSKDDIEIARQSIELVVELMKCLGIDLKSQESSGGSEETPSELIELAKKYSIVDDDNQQVNIIDEIIALRKRAREEKNWDLADDIRDSLSSAGYTIEDTKQGTKIVKN